MTNDYQPVSCRMHSELELAVMRRAPLRLRWREGEAEREATARPLDVRTEARVEYLIAEDDTGAPLKIRLDRLLGFEAG